MHHATHSLPDRLGTLEHLQHIDVSNNKLLSHLPPRLGSNGRLENLLMSCCNISQLPGALGSSPLRQLDAKDNRLTSIPVCI